jgi:hypothetical protein
MGLKLVARDRRGSIFKIGLFNGPEAYLHDSDRWMVRARRNRAEVVK